jgi:hypothetical protein
MDGNMENTQDVHEVPAAEQAVEIAEPLSEAAPVAQHVEQEAPVSQKENVFVLNAELLQKGNERALWEAAGKMVAAASREKNEEEEEAARVEYDKILAENLEEAKVIQSEIDAEKAELVAKYGNEDQWPLNAKKQNKINSLSWATGGVLGLVAFAAAAPAHAGGHDAIKEFGNNLGREIRVQIGEAGRDSGAVIGGAARVGIDRAVNATTAEVLRRMGVPVAQTPEEVVVVPRSIPGGGYGVYGPGQLPPPPGVYGGYPRGNEGSDIRYVRSQEVGNLQQQLEAQKGIAAQAYGEMMMHKANYERTGSKGESDMYYLKMNEYNREMININNTQRALNVAIQNMRQGR